MLLQSGAPQAVIQLKLYKSDNVKNPEAMKNLLKEKVDVSLAKWAKNKDFRYRLIQIQEKVIITSVKKSFGGNDKKIIQRLEEDTFAELSIVEKNCCTIHPSMQ